MKVKLDLVNHLNAEYLNTGSHSVAHYEQYVLLLEQICNSIINVIQFKFQQKLQPSYSYNN